MRTATIWRECAHCGMEFSQPDDPGRKRRYCSDACKQAAYRERQRARHEHDRRAREEDASRQREDARRYRQYQDYQRQERSREEARRQRAYQPPPHSSNGHHTDSAEQARARRIVEALLRKAASTNYPHEATACRAKAEELRRKHGL